MLQGEHLCKHGPKGLGFIHRLFRRRYRSSIIYKLYVRRGRELNGRQHWVKPWIERRQCFGQYENLMIELARESRGDFVQFRRIPPEMIERLIDRLTPRLTKVTTNFRVPHSPGLKLAITLRHLASGNSYHSPAFSKRCSINKTLTVSCSFNEEG